MSLSAARGSQHVVQWPKGGGGWASALTMFAKSKSPKSSLPKGVYLRSDDQTVAIYDGYAKAKFHFLVLPRIPFVLKQGSADPSPVRDPEIDAPTLALHGSQLSFGKSVKGSTVPDSHLRSLNSLLASPYAEQVLQALEEQSRHVIQLIREEMRHTPLLSNKDDRTLCGVEWNVRVGFHAVPSMETVHLHIISDDLVSERLKHKKHYQSFHPTHGFWLDLSYVLGLIKSGKKKLPHAPDHYEALLKRPLISFRNGGLYKDMPSLKRHLDEAWVSEIVRRRSESRNAATGGLKHKRESEDAEENARFSKTGRSTGDGMMGK